MCEALLHPENYDGFIEIILNYYLQTSKGNLENMGMRIEVEGHCPSKKMNILLNKLAESGVNVL